MQDIRFDARPRIITLPPGILAPHTTLVREKAVINVVPSFIIVY